MTKGQRVADEDDSAIYFRADRVSLINGKFFFATREGTLEGPYDSKREACLAIDNYIRRMTAPQPKWPTKDSGMTFSLSLDH